MTRARTHAIYIATPVIALTAAALAGCYRAGAEAAVSQPEVYRAVALGARDLNSFGIFTDHAAGCQYVVWNGYEKGGITPRLNEYGQPICRKVGQ